MIMKKTAFNWTRLLRTMVALLVIMSMLLCGCAGGGDNDDDDEGGKKNEGTSADSGLVKGDGDGKLEAEDVVDNVSGIYGSLLGLVGGDKNSLINGGYGMDMTVTLGDSILSQFQAMLEQEGMDTDISWFKSLGFAVEVLYNENLSQINMEAKLNGKGILSLEAVADLMAAEVFLKIPELSKEYIGGAVDLDMNMEDFVEQYNQILAQMEEYGDVVTALPTEEELNTLLDRYLEAAKVALGEPETGSETLTAGGVSVEVNAVTYTITRSKILAMAEAILTTAKTDAELETVLDNFGAWYNEKMAQEQEGYEAADFHALLMEAVEEGLASLAEIKEDIAEEENDTEALSFSNYLADDKSVGFALSVNGGYESTSVYMYNLEKDGQTAFLLNAADSLVIEGSGTTSSGKASGNYTVTVQGQEMLYLEVKDFDTKALNKGELKGTLRLRFSEEMLDSSYNDSMLTPETVIELNLNLGGGKSAIAVNFYMGSDLLFGFELSTKSLSGKISLPGSYVDVNSSSALENWVAGISFDRIISNLRSAGVDKDLVDMLEETLDQAMGGGY